MRPLYLFLKITLPYAYSVFFKRKKIVNNPKKRRAQTIFVSNHPSAFLDPLVIASLGRPVVHFMTRSDVFKWWLKPVTWACQMVPIYRADQDGSGTYDKNQNVFVDIQQVLIRRRSLIMFGEGYTDNVFIRSLKPMKKGPPRIGISTMEATNWELDIKIQAIGMNYTRPGAFRSDLLISYGKAFHLKDFKEIYDENPNKAMLQIMREIGDEIQNNLTYVEDKSKADFFEHVLILSRKGMNHNHYDKHYSLEERFNYSRALAKRMNSEYDENATDWAQLEEITEEYFSSLKKKKTEDNFVYRYQKNKETKGLWKNWLFLILTFPLFLFGSIHNAIPYFISKTVVEKLFKRKVFWSGVKVVVGGLLWLLYTLPIFWLFPAYLYPLIPIEGWMGFAISMIYFWTIPALSFIFWHHWKTTFKQTIAFSRIKESDLKLWIGMRDQAKQKMDEIGI